MVLADRKNRYEEVKRLKHKVKKKKIPKLSRSATQGRGTEAHQGGVDKSLRARRRNEEESHRSLKPCRASAGGGAKRETVLGQWEGKYSLNRKVLKKRGGTAQDYLIETEDLYPFRRGEGRNKTERGP